MKNWIYIIILVVISFGIALFMELAGGHTITLKSYSITLIWSLFYSLVLGLGNAHLNTFLDRFYSWTSHTWKRVVLGFFSTIFYTVIGSAFVLLVMLVWIHGNPISALWSPRALTSYVMIVKWSLIISGFFHLRGFILAYKQKYKEAEELKTQKLQAEINLLQQQMDAHFLFNSLSVLKELIEEDRTLANTYIDQFSSVYRYIVENKDKSMISLQEELDFIESYLYIHKTRFEKALEVNVQVDNCSKKTKIPPMSLQIGLENALKHNILTPKSPLCIDIYCDRDFIIIENNLQLKQGVKGTGTALVNLDKRTKMLTEKSIYFGTKGDKFVLKIPLNHG
jgi:hypothetical protein